MSDSKGVGIAIDICGEIADDALFAVVERAARDYARRYPGGEPYLPTRGNRIVFARNRRQRVIGFAAWQEWENKAFIGQAWIAPAYRRRGVYSLLVGRLLEEAGERGLKGVSACVDTRNAVSVAVHDALMNRKLVFYEAAL